MKPPKLIAITQPTVGVSPEEFIAYAARISNPSNQMNAATAPKLLAYLVKAGHWSPFDMIDMTVEVTTSKAIAIQLLRHWSFRFQEFSQRYSTVEEFSYDNVEMRRKHEGGNRQGSGDVDLESSNDAGIACNDSACAYSYLIEKGIAPESARMVLPLATLTTLYMKGSVRSWMTYFWQRLDPHAQKEHRELAMEIFKIFHEEFPVVSELVRTHKPAVVENLNWSEAP
jgi:thymidylate synthase (FAD)